MQGPGKIRILSPSSIDSYGRCRAYRSPNCCSEDDPAYIWISDACDGSYSGERDCARDLLSRHWDKTRKFCFSPPEHISLHIVSISCLFIE